MMAWRRIGDKPLSESMFTRIYAALGGVTQGSRKAAVLQTLSLEWRHDGLDGVSNHQPHDCLLNRSFRRRSKKTSKIRVTGFCEGNSPVTRFLKVIALAIKIRWNLLAGDIFLCWLRWKYHTISNKIFQSCNFNVINTWYTANSLSS